jgi:hypothetical protein
MASRSVLYWVRLLLAVPVFWPVLSVAASLDYDRVDQMWLLPGGAGNQFDQALEAADGASEAIVPSFDVQPGKVRPASNEEAFSSRSNVASDPTMNPLRQSNSGRVPPHGVADDSFGSPSYNPVRSNPISPPITALRRLPAIASPQAAAMEGARQSQAEAPKPSESAATIPAGTEGVPALVYPSQPEQPQPVPATAYPSPPESSPRVFRPLPSLRPAPAMVYPSPQEQPQRDDRSQAVPRPAPAMVYPSPPEQPQRDDRSQPAPQHAPAPTYPPPDQIQRDNRQGLDPQAVRLPIPDYPAQQPAAVAQAAQPPSGPPRGPFPQLPSNYDISALEQTPGRQLDPLSAAMAGGLPPGAPPVRYASQEEVLPLPAVPLPSGPMPNGPMPTPEVVPAPVPFEVPMEAGTGPVVMETAPGDHLAWLHRILWDGNTRDPNHDHGIAYERVQLAPYIIDTVLPTNQYGIRFDAAYHWRAPDFGDLLVAQPQSAGGVGLPVADRRLNYQDFDFVSELGNSTVSARTIVPLRLIDGTDNGDTAGLGDVEMDTKLVMLNGEYIKFAQFTGMHFNSGFSMKGLGTGHISIEPGMLASLKLSDETYLHSEVKFLFPIADLSNQKSNLLTWGVGLSHVLYDFDSFAVIPSVEAVFYTVLNGGYTQPGPVPVFVGSNWVTVPTIHYGVRMMTDRVRDLGLIEFGLSGGLSAGSNVWYEGLLRAEVRVIY